MFCAFCDLADVPFQQILSSGLVLHYLESFSCSAVFLWMPMLLFLFYFFPSYILWLLKIFWSYPATALSVWCTKAYLSVQA